MADYTIYKESKYDKHILKSGCKTYNARSYGNNILPLVRIPSLADPAHIIFVLLGRYFHALA